MSRFTADSFVNSSQSGNKPPFGCVGDTEQSFTECILQLHNSKLEWNSAQRKGFDFLEQTHKRDVVQQRWSDIIDHAMYS